MAAPNININNHYHLSIGPSGPFSLQILTINVCSLISYQQRHALNSLLRSAKPDICLVKETKLSAKHKLSFPNYDLIRHDSSPGILIAHISSIRCQAFSLPPGRTSVSGACNISSNLTQILMMCIYVRCKSSGADLLSAGNGFDQIIIDGDFNARHLSWNNPVANNTGNTLLSFTQTNPDFTISYPSSYTLHNHPSTIDLFLSNSTCTSIRNITTTFSEYCL